LIRLSKGDEPTILSENAAAWTSELLDALENRSADVPGIKSRYNHPTVKAALKAETSEKCAYCESNMLHVTYGDIEHIAPKSADPNLTFDWKNLTLACDVCNTKKGSREGILDPYAVDPEGQFTFFGPMLIHNPGCNIAEYTKISLELNRTALLEKRREAIDNISNLLVRIEQNPDEYERQLILEETLNAVTAPSREFAACARAFVMARKAT
jgi:uncharacterized protein (TIGR02646 family)